MIPRVRPPGHSANYGYQLQRTRPLHPTPSARPINCSPEFDTCQHPLGATFERPLQEVLAYDMTTTEPFATIRLVAESGGPDAAAIECPTTPLRKPDFSCFRSHATGCEPERFRPARASTFWPRI